MSNPQQPLSPEEISLLELFERLDAVQQERVYAIVTDRIEGRASHAEFQERLRALSAG
ncbi:conserved hypothetical protein [Pseudomonas sp. 8Z]|uniref:hypothetical protein n=1 Tax=Pseudomonas sp. 8Z TaxID=2653166 RepID=UPI0012F309B4|nr:hypothetical protein [Pseudomonas sp. 8Z]VXC24876.1 conserved hypothetical protein [Pseudomonas sp. 8Z]